MARRSSQFLNRSLRSAGLIILLLFTYQNCADSGFQAIDTTSGAHTGAQVTPPIIDPGDGGGGGTTPTPPEATLTARVVGTEFVPIELEIYPTKYYKSLKVDSLPVGMIYNATSRRLYWLPRKGQAGTWRVYVRAQKDDNIYSRYIEFQINPMTDDQLRKGPPDIFKDGDVGYVFVHGAGGQDRCQDYKDLEAYWGASPGVVAPDSSNRLVACYDGRRAVADTAAGVAKQILNASCGRYQRCIIITHSMGGLMLEHMLTHAREARSGDPDPQNYAAWQLYKMVQDKTLFVISLGSAAGGSKVASILEAPEHHEAIQFVIGNIADWIGQSDDSTHNLEVSIATRSVVPFREDPGVPFFMIPGYSVKRLNGGDGFFDGIWDYLFGSSLPVTVFQGDSSLAVVDNVAEFHSRSDGLVDFRSACGVASDVENEGPGINATLDSQFNYCYSAPKKPNHYVWFLINLNHFLLTLPYADCSNPKNPCMSHFPDFNVGAFVENTTYRTRNVMSIIRDGLTANRNNVNVQPLRITVDW